MVVLFDSARSAEPPQNSGTVFAIAWITAPEALRVAIPFSSAGKVGRSSAQPSGRWRPFIRWSSLLRTAYREAHSW